MEIALIRQNLGLVFKIFRISSSGWNMNNLKVCRNGRAIAYVDLYQWLDMIRPLFERLLWREAVAGFIRQSAERQIRILCSASEFFKHGIAALRCTECFSASSYIFSSSWHRNRWKPVKFLREKRTNLQTSERREDFASLSGIMWHLWFPLLLPRGPIWASGFGKRKQQINEVTSGTFWWNQKTLSWMRLNFSVAFSRWINPIALCYCNQSSSNVIPRQVTCQGVSVTIASHVFISLT